MRYWRKAWRDVRAMRSRAVLLLLVIGAGIGTAAGIALALHDVQATRDAFYRDYHLADLDIRLSGAVPTGQLLARARAVSTPLPFLSNPGRSWRPLRPPGSRQCGSCQTKKERWR